MNAKVRRAIAVLISATVFRAQTALFLPTVEMFGGIAPDAWLAPWFSDAVLGFMVPLMVYLFWSKRSVVVWGVLVIYNAVGAFDYATGLATQWTDPIPAEIASATTVYLGIGIFMVCQLIALAMLFRSDVIEDFADRQK